MHEESGCFDLDNFENVFGNIDDRNHSVGNRDDDVSCKVNESCNGISVNVSDDRVVDCAVFNSQRFKFKCDLKFSKRDINLGVDVSEFKFKSRFAKDKE